MKRVCFLMITFLFCVASSAVAGIFKWTDDQGGVHYTDNEKNIPEPYRDKAVNFEETERGGSVTYNPELGVAAPLKEGEEPYYKRFLREVEAERIAKEEAARKPQVTLYMTDW
ncbi:MAG: DUF4124 domain-containing protein [bacterium]|nr:DUF4124 domain-containing protein [bacterium]